MQRLDGMDASFVYLDTPATPMHVGTTCVFDPSTAADEYSFRKVRRLVEDRLHHSVDGSWRCPHTCIVPDGSTTPISISMSISIASSCVPLAASPSWSSSQRT